MAMQTHRSVIAWLPVLSAAALTGINGVANKELRETIGWPELVATVGSVYANLEADEQATTTIITRNYGQAGAASAADTGWLAFPPRGRIRQSLADLARHGSFSHPRASQHGQSSHPTRIRRLIGRYAHSMGIQMGCGCHELI